MDRLDSVPCLCPCCERVVIGPVKHLGKTLRCPACHEKLTFSYPPPEVLAWIPEEVVWAFLVLPLAVDDGTITIATRNPDDLEVQRELEFMTSRRVRLKKARLDAIAAAISSLYRAGVPFLRASGLSDVPEEVLELELEMPAVSHKPLRVCVPGDEPIVCRCAECHTRYVLGVNALAIVFEESIEEEDLHRSPDGQAENIPDLVGLIHGEKSWPDNVAPSTPGVDVPEVVLEARDRKAPRLWRCANCQSRQPYRWSRAEEGSAPEVIFAATLAEAVGKVPGEAVRASDHISRPIAEEFRVLALAVGGDDLYIGVPNAGDDCAREMTDLLRFLLRRPIKAVVIPVEEITEALAREYSADSSRWSNSAVDEAAQAANAWNSIDTSADLDGTDGVPALTFVDRILRVIMAAALESQASEVLLRPTQTSIQIFLRTPKSPCPSPLPPPPEYFGALILNYIGNSTSRKGIFTFKLQDKALKVRVSFERTRHGRAAILYLPQREPAAETTKTEIPESGEQGSADADSEAVRFCPHCARQLPSNAHTCGACAFQASRRPSSPPGSGLGLLGRIRQQARARDVSLQERLERTRALRAWQGATCERCHNRTPVGGVVCPICGFDHALDRPPEKWTIPTRSAMPFAAKDRLASEMSAADAECLANAGSEAPRFCPHCGRELRIGARACDTCQSQAPPSEPPDDMKRSIVTHAATGQEPSDYTRFWQAWSSAKCEKCNNHLPLGRVVCAHCGFDHALDRPPAEPGILSQYVLPFDAKHLPPDDEDA